MNEYIVEVGQHNAQQVLIEASFQQPVLIDFWADWCAPCKALMPILEKLAHEYAGALLVAKVDCDAEAGIASQFGVQSLPTVVLMKDGQPVDGFTGAQPESAIRRLLEPHLPKPWDTQLNEAGQLIEAGDFGAALGPLRQAYADSRQRPDIAVTLARVLLELKRYDEAEQVLDAVRLADQDAGYREVRAQLDLKRQAAKTPEIQALEAAHAADAADLDVAYQLALQYTQQEHHREALELLISILRQSREYGDGAARKTLLDIIAALGSRDPLAVEFQRKLFSILY